MAKSKGRDTADHLGDSSNLERSTRTIGEEFALSGAYPFWRRVLRLVRVRTKMTSLSLRNRISRQPIVGNVPAVVSLTTHGHRIELVYHAIESIGKGSERPKRVILWLDEPAALISLPPELVRLQKRGLEVKLSNNYGPHTKYHPYIESRPANSPLALVTADDDTVYPRQWLRGLVKALEKDPASVWCYRAHRLTFRDRELQPYSDWSRASSSLASYRNFATGVSGVIYPPRMQDALKEAGLDFIKVAPRADDVWLHAMAVRTGCRVRQVGAVSQDYDIVRGTWAGGLVGTNVAGGNDDQIRATYTETDVSKILSDTE